MAQIFVIRHGHYSGSDLTGRGRRQIEDTAVEMKAILGEMDGGHYLLSSTAPRARQSAEIIDQAFGIGFAEHLSLYTSGGFLRGDELEGIHSLVSPALEENSVVTLATHYEVANNYPRYLSHKMMDMKIDLPHIEKGQGVHIDLAARTYQQIPRRP